MDSFLDNYKDYFFTLYKKETMFSRFTQSTYVKLTCTENITPDNEYLLVIDMYYSIIPYEKCLELIRSVSPQIEIKFRIKSQVVSHKTVYHVQRYTYYNDKYFSSNDNENGYYQHEINLFIDLNIYYTNLYDFINKIISNSSIDIMHQGNNNYLFTNVFITDLFKYVKYEHVDKLFNYLTKNNVHDTYHKNFIPIIYWLVGASLNIDAKNILKYLLVTKGLFTYLFNFQIKKYKHERYSKIDTIFWGEYLCSHNKFYINKYIHLILIIVHHKIFPKEIIIEMIRKDKMLYNHFVYRMSHYLRYLIFNHEGKYRNLYSEYPFNTYENISDYVFTLINDLLIPLNILVYYDIKDIYFRGYNIKLGFKPRHLSCIYLCDYSNNKSIVKKPCKENKYVLLFAWLSACHIYSNM